MPTSYHPAPTAANDPPAPVIKPADPDPEPTDPPRPWSVKPAAWSATIATIRELADATSWWRVWVIIHQRRPSIPWDGVTFSQLHQVWNQERETRGLESLGPWSTAEADR